MLEEGQLAAYNTVKGSQGAATCDAELLNICDDLSMNEPPLFSTIPLQLK